MFKAIMAPIRRKQLAGLRTQHAATLAERDAYKVGSERRADAQKRLHKLTAQILSKENEVK